MLSEWYARLEGLQVNVAKLAPACAPCDLKVLRGYQDSACQSTAGSSSAVAFMVCRILSECLLHISQVLASFRGESAAKA